MNKYEDANNNERERDLKKAERKNLIHLYLLVLDE